MSDPSVGSFTQLAATSNSSTPICTSKIIGSTRYFQQLGIGIDGLGLQALELEVFEVGLIALLKISLGFVGSSHAGVSSRNIAKSPQQN